MGLDGDICTDLFNPWRTIAIDRHERQVVDP